MKAFKEWLEKYSHGEMISQRYELQDAWRAALKWSLSESGGDCDYHIIEEELEDGF